MTITSTTSTARRHDDSHNNHTPTTLPNPQATQHYETVMAAMGAAVAARNMTCLESLVCFFIYFYFVYFLLHYLF